MVASALTCCSPCRWMNAATEVARVWRLTNLGHCVLVLEVRRPLLTRDLLGAP